MGKNIEAALLQVQMTLGAVKKDSENPHFHNTYASLEAVIAAVKGPLNDAGILFMQMPTIPPFENHLALRTVFIHAASGETIEDVTVLPLQKADPQGAGSAITYARRYALLAALGIPTEDDDAESAAPRSASPRADTTKKKTSLFPTAKGGRNASDV